jgi:hypothetical protein
VIDLRQLSGNGTPAPGGRPNAEPGAGAPAVPRGGGALIKYG